MRNRFKRRRFQTYIYLVLVLFIFTMGIGYAALSETLTIEGTTDIDEASWNVHFQNVAVTEGSVTATTAPTITDNTNVSFGVNLENPGDFYDFTVDVINEGTFDAKLNTISILPVLTATDANFFDYTVTYENGDAIAADDVLLAGDMKTIHVRFEYLTQLDTTLYPTEDQSFNFSVAMNYIQSRSS